MNGLHPIHVITLGLAALAAIFAFVGMRVAFEARDAVWSAASGSDGDNWYEIDQLQTAMIRAGLIEDPSVIPDDHQELDGPWARCLTADERAEMGPTDDVELPASCASVEVVLEDDCPEPAHTLDDEDEWADDIDVADDCYLSWRVGGRRFTYWDVAHPVDVEAIADEWLLADSSDGADRLARGDDQVFIHVIGEGWLQLYPD